jgi:crotonobetainyl-CoA:carnitine CoA-transferase CaiB-like acyl-CoA transferase
VALDLARPKAIELFLRLVARADVVVSNYSAA